MRGVGEVLRGGELGIVEEGGDEVAVFGTDRSHLVFYFFGEG